MKFYILQNLDRGFLGNSPCFWLERGGYGQWIDQARKFTEEEADKIIRSTSSSHKFKKWDWDLIDQVGQRTVDIQDLPVNEFQEAVKL